MLVNDQHPRLPRRSLSTPSRLLNGCRLLDGIELVVVRVLIERFDFECHALISPFRGHADLHARLQVGGLAFLRVAAHFRVGRDRVRMLLAIRSRHHQLVTGDAHDLAIVGVGERAILVDGLDVCDGLLVIGLKRRHADPGTGLDVGCLAGFPVQGQLGVSGQRMGVLWATLAGHHQRGVRDVDDFALVGGFFRFVGCEGLPRHQEQGECDRVELDHPEIHGHRLSFKTWGAYAEATYLRATQTFRVHDSSETETGYWSTTSIRRFTNAVTA